MAPRPALVAQVRETWARWAGVPVDAFTAGAVHSTVSPESKTAPTRWVGVVVIDDAALATAPDAETARRVEDVLGDRSLDDVVGGSAWQGVLGVRDVLGPAWLSCGTSDDVIARDGPHQVRFAAADDADLGLLLAGVDSAEAGESGLSEVTSRVAVIDGESGVVAAAGYQGWSGDVAHLCLLTAPEVRGQGLAPVVASAAAAEAGRLGLLLQWRARPAPSRRVAAGIGLHELGWQLSFDCSP